MVMSASAPKNADSAKKLGSLRQNQVALAGAAGETVATVAAAKADRLRLAGAVSHVDGLLKASDGASIAFRTTAPAGKPKAVLVLQMGTLGKREYFDGLGELLAKEGVKSYAVEPRTYAAKHWQHALDLDQVVRLAARENPGAPLTVGGVSLGSAIALDWSARHNPKGLKVLAMSPVVMPRFLGPIEMGKAAAGNLSERIGKHLVNTPMSKRIPLTTNPASPEFRFSNPETMKVPAKLFGDVVTMTAEVGAKGHRMRGPLFVAMAGDDKVAVNLATRAFTKLIRSSDKTVEVFPKLAHDLSQEWHDPRLVRKILRFVLPK